MGSAVGVIVGSLEGMNVASIVGAMVGLVVGRIVESFVEFMEGLLDGNLVVVDDSDDLCVGLIDGILIGIEFWSLESVIEGFVVE